MPGPGARVNSCGGSKMSGAPSFKWLSASVTNVGNVRKINEDSVLDLPSRGLWVVADGMGGHAAGDVASQMIVETLRQVPSVDKLSDFVNVVEDHLMEANRKLFEMSISGPEQRVIGSTAAALLAFGNHCLCAWVGDSRVYRLRDGEFQQVTRDHSEVEEMLEQGLITLEDAVDHPSGNVITRAVGGARTLFVDLELLELQKGDRFLVCSDGLYKELSEDEMQDCLASGNCKQVSQNLVDMALARECADNVTVVVVEFDQR
jgi:serine/threonine protein phosphatase PrpC